MTKDSKVMGPNKEAHTHRQTDKRTDVDPMV